MKKIIVPLVIISVAVIGLCTTIDTPHSPRSSTTAITVYASSSGVQSGEWIATFKTADGEILAEIQTIDCMIPTNLIPNAPFILHRPFLRWTNVQGFSLDGILTQNLTFLPLYSYDPTWDGSDGGGNSGSGIKIPEDDGYYKKTQWVWMNFLLDEKQVIFGTIIGGGFLLLIVFIFLRLLRGVIHK